MSGIGGTGMFQFGGLASGLDTKTIISSLVALERQPIKVLEQSKALRKTQKGAFSDLESKLEELLSSLDDIRKTSNFLEFNATPGEEGYFTASADSSAVKGTWDITVKQLASVQRNLSSGYASASNDLLTTSSGVLKINEHSIALANGSNLYDIASAINTANSEYDIGVTAAVIDTGSDFKLQLSAEEGGTENSFTISMDGGVPAELQALVNDLNANQTDAQDALLAINDVDIIRSTNTITDAIAGVTLNLTKVHADTPTWESTSLTIGTEASQIADKIQAFIDDYNAVIDFMENQTRVNEEGEAEGSLVGDFTLGTIRRQLRSITGGTVDSGNNAYSMLAFVGVEADQEGRLSLNRSELEEALADDEQAVKNLFTKKEEGISARLYDLVDEFTDSVDGLIVNRKEGLDRLMKDLDRRIEQAEDRADRYEARLVKQFAAYESLISQYQSQGAALSYSGLTDLGNGS